MSWDTVESAPEVLSEMLESLGVKGCSVEELWALDKDLLAPMQPYALFFLFKYKKSLYRTAGGAATNPDNQAVIDSTYFARQTVNNACCTLALLHGLFNTELPLELGPALSEFRAFSADLPSDIRGDLLVSSDVIRETHNSFARPEPFEIEEDLRPRRGGEAFHFIAFLPRQGKVLEIDGLKPNPVVIGDCSASSSSSSSSSDWLDIASAEIQRRMADYATAASSSSGAGAGGDDNDDGGEIRFNLLALVKDKRISICEQLRACLVRLEAVSALIGALKEEEGGAGDNKAERLSAEIAADIPEFSSTSSSSSSSSSGSGDDDFNPPADDVDELLRVEGQLVAKIQGLREDYKGEQERREAGRIENARRRHNFVPLIMELMSQMAKKGQLTKALEEGRRKQQAQKERAKAEAAAAKKGASAAASSS